MRALSVMIRVISFATARQQAAQRLRNSENELPYFSLAETRLDQSLGLVTFRDLFLVIISRRKAFLSKKEKIGPE
jgi:hypothetical protein